MGLATANANLQVPAGITLFWRFLDGRPGAKDKLSEVILLTLIAIVMVGTSVAEERTFLWMNFTTEQRPSLTTNLETVVRMVEQGLFDMSNFPLAEAREQYLAMVPLV